MKKVCAVLPILLFVSACHHAPEDPVPTSAETPEPARTEAPLEVPATSASIAADDSADRFICAYGGSKADEYQVVITDFAVGGDHMGPIGEYKVTGGGPYKGATGDARLSDDTYEFLSGPLGKVHAKIAPLSQGLFGLLVGNEMVQCDKQGSEQDQ